ncbi:MAG: galactokinase [Micromonosporaceae bacterium]|nr:galactokinase [Micromonosporaceae bacterium]
MNGGEPVSAALRAETLFRERFGQGPDGAWAAPGRANLIGEHTDYNDGFVLPFALDRLTVVAAATAAARRWTVCSEARQECVDFDESALVPGGVPGWAGYVAGVIWSLRQAGYDVPGASLAIASDVPVGAGLSSSAALECSVLGALADLGGLDLPVGQRPVLAQRAEAEYVGMPCGLLDQSASVLCQAGQVLFLDCRSFEMTQIPFDATAAGLTVLIIDTRAEHGLVDGEYAARRQSCEAAAKALGLRALREVDVEELPMALDRLPDEVLRHRTRHVVTENARVIATVKALRSGDLAGIGPLLTASHASLRDDYEVTVDQLDTAVEAALAAGAHGARMTGGGFGGCVLALVDTTDRDRVAGAVTEAFDRAGFTAPIMFTTPPGDGARRLW